MDVTVLAVDDEPLQVELLRRVLERAGYKVLSAGSAEEAERVFDSAPAEIDLLVTDVVMPDVDGPTLAEQLRAKKPDLRVLFVSGFLARHEWVAYCGQSQAHSFVAKPFSPSVLIQEVRKTLAAGKKQ